MSGKDYCEEDEPCETIEYEEKEEVTKARAERIWIIKRLAEDLFKVLGKHKTAEEIAFKRFFGISKKEVKLLVSAFPPYERTQAIYGINHFVKENCKIKLLANYDDDETPPVYESVKVKRKETEILLTVGYYFVTWKNTKFIIEPYFRGMTHIIRLWFRAQNKKKAENLDKTITKYLKECNFMKGEKLALVSRGYIEFLEYPNMDWENVVLPEKTKEEFMLNIIFPLKNEKECVKRGIPWRRGLMLGGKAGTGKTQVCRILCNVLPKGVTLIWATPKALYDEETIQHLFEAARYFSPTLIVLEDIDFIGTSRNFTQNPILGELLTQLDGNDPNHGIFVVATTNRPELLDEALANRPSRFDVQVKFSLPDESDRIRLVKLFTKNMEFVDELNVNLVASRMKGLTGAHIKEVFIYCQLKALKRDGKGKITNDDVMERLTYYDTLLKEKKLVI